jgi:SAM-dependent methyltransferase
MKTPDQGYYDNARREIEPLLPPNLGSVLEIGCGEGNTLLWLQHSGLAKSCRGLEILPDVASRGKAAGLDIVVADIESKGIPFKDQYDLVLCLDVLEHLHEPWSTMKVIADSIKPGGYFIASIPNISHVSILSGLIFRDQ